MPYLLRGCNANAIIVQSISKEITLSKNNLIYIAGSIWLMTGAFLIYRGSHLYQLAVSEQHSTQLNIIVSVLAGLIIGAIKGRFILSKTAGRNLNRIQSLEPPIKVHQVFTKSFYGFIFGMMLLGVLLRTMNEYLGGYLVVAAIYCGIGTALIVSSLVYWRGANIGSET